MTAPMDHPLVWPHPDGRKSLLLGTHADSIIGMPSVNGRALLWRLQQWAAQPDFVYRHEWQIGHLVLWNNEGLMHRVIPYTDGRRTMHRTTINGEHSLPYRIFDKIRQVNQAAIVDNKHLDAALMMAKIIQQQLPPQQRKNNEPSRRSHPATCFLPRTNRT